MSELIHSEINGVTAENASLITIAPAERCALVNLMSKTTVEANTEVVGACGVWEPNVLDGLDQEFIGALDTDASGRFIPYWSRTKAGVRVEPLEGFDVSGSREYYL
jgi:methyl-accepting chemotaxis protein